MQLSLSGLLTIVGQEVFLEGKWGPAIHFFPAESVQLIQSSELRIQPLACVAAHTAFVLGAVSKKADGELFYQLESDMLQGLQLPPGWLEPLIILSPRVMKTPEEKASMEKVPCFFVFFFSFFFLSHVNLSFLFMLFAYKFLFYACQQQLQGLVKAGFIIKEERRSLGDVGAFITTFYRTSTLHLAFYRDKIAFQPSNELPSVEAVEPASNAFQPLGQCINISQLPEPSRPTQRELVCVQHYFFCDLFFFLLTNLIPFNFDLYSFAVRVAE